MYLRLTRGSFDPSRVDEVMRLNQDIRAALQRLPGFQDAQSQVGIDRNAGRLVAVTTWDTEEHARFSRETLGDVLTRMQAVGSQLEPPEVYEVTAE